MSHYDDTIDEDILKYEYMGEYESTSRYMACMMFTLSELSSYQDDALFWSGLMYVYEPEAEILYFKN